jgi:tyrosinase
MARTRQDVAGLTLGDAEKAQTQQWHPVLDTYARGVALMQDLSEDDPQSWLYAANTHGTPFGTPNRPTWSQCAHGSTFFLPWHRAYLAWFEATVRAVTGDDDWALPYWDYTVPGDDADRTLPVEFAVRTRTVDGQVVTNPLFVRGRRSGPIPAADVDIVEALSDAHFVQPFPRSGFGGTDPDRSNGDLEMIPHNFVHDDISGLMGSTATAARDPIFWLHHANVDRLWEVWRGLPGSVAVTDPGAASALLVTQWQSSVFVFGDLASPATFAMADVEDLAVLDYGYEQTGLPDDLAAAVQEARDRAGGGLEVADMTGTGAAWEPVAATFNVTSGEDRDIRITSGAGEASATSAPVGGLVIELAGVRATDPHAVYVVEVRSSPDAEAHRAGRISTFGLAGTPESEERTYVVDASSVLPVLRDEGWSGDQLSIRVAPEEGRADSDDPDKAIRVRQVTLYVPTA